MNIIVARIDELRKKKGLTKKALMSKMGVPFSTANSWFYDETFPSLANIDKVCKALDVTVQQFFSGMGEVDNKAEQEFLDYWRTMNDNEKVLIRNVIDDFKAIRKAQND